MKTLNSIIAMTAHRLPARLKFVSTRIGSLILLFQRMPVVQFLFPEANIIGGATLANSVSLAVTTVIGLTTYDAVAGSTTINEVQPLPVTGFITGSTTTANGINVPATVSASLNFEFVCNNAPSDPESWRSNNSAGTTFVALPTGLSMLYTATTPDDGNGGFIQNNFITGTPATAGIFPVYITVYRGPNYTTEKVTQLFNICALGFSTQPAASTTITSGSTASLTCVATGVPVATTKHNVTPTVTYQWYQGNSGTMTTPVGTANSTTPGFTTPTLSSSTNYWVRIKSVLGTSTVYANSNTAAVTVSTPSVVSVAVSPASVLENSGSAMVYTFTRTGSTASSLTANYTAGGTATADTDYPSTTSPVTFAAGSATATVSVTPTGDTTVESDETVTLTVAAGTGYTADATTATGTITNDDTPFSSWASGLGNGQNGTGDMPQGDGVTNLAKFAFNMNSSAPDLRRLTVGGSETAGLPAGAKSGAGGVLRIEFLRRKSSTSPGITYTTQFTSDFVTWSDFAGSPVSVSSVDSTWERVVVDDPTGGATRFVRIKVTAP